MSEVKRYYWNADDIDGLGYGSLDLLADASSQELVSGADFDRVTAECDELQRQLDHKEQQRESELRNGQAGDRLVGSRSAASNWQDVLRLSGEVQRTNDKLYAAEKEREALQQRLTAADERVDVLEGLLRESREAHACLAKDIAAERRYQSLPGWMGNAESDLRYMQAKIDAALKPAEPAKDEHVCTGCGSKGWTANCKECVPY